MGSTLRGEGVGGVIVEVDGLCREGNSIPRGIDFKGTNPTLAVLYAGVYSLCSHAIASFCVYPSSSSEVMDEG